MSQQQPMDRSMIDAVASLSPLEQARLAYRPLLPTCLQSSDIQVVQGDTTSAYADAKTIEKLFPHTYGQRVVQFVSAANASSSAAASSSSSSSSFPSTPLRIGIVLSGGPASGGHNVITGLFDFLQTRIHTDSKLYGFLDGPSGLVDNKYIELTRTIVDRFRNQGGFHMIGSGRTKIETAKQFEQTAQTCANLKLDGLVVVGGDDSNTNAALLAEYFREKKSAIRVVGAPKTIDGDLRNEYLAMSFGFDTACKVYSEQVAALCADAVSARKTYHFCRLMGRTASHITLEVALQTHPNIALIGEEIQKKGQTLRSVVCEIADCITTRAAQDRHYGCVILPEGLIDFLTDFSALMNELNEMLAENQDRGLPSNITAHLTPASASLFTSLPTAISQQLLLDRDSHGNVQVAKIESERLVAALVEQELLLRKKLGTYRGSPSFVCHFLGYEGRCGLPSNFDANYCYALGQTCGSLIATGCTGMIAAIQGLTQPASEWKCGGMPLTHLMNLERRSGHDKPVIRKALVNLSDLPFRIFELSREQWKYQDAFRNPGSIQYEGIHADSINLTMELEQRGRNTKPIGKKQEIATASDNTSKKKSAIQAKL